MHATIGDRLHVHGNAVGHPDRTGEVVEVHGAREGMGRGVALQEADRACVQH